MKNKLLALLLSIIMVIIGTADGTVHTKAALTDVYYSSPGQVVYGNTEYAHAIFVDDYYCALEKGKAFLYATKCKGSTLIFPTTIAYNYKIYRTDGIYEFIGKDLDEDYDYWPGEEFENKKKVKKIIIPEKVTGVRLFLSTWKNVKEIRLPASVDYAILGHTTAKIVISKKNKYLKKYKNGIYRKKNQALMSTCGNKSTFTVKKGTKYLYPNAFYGYKKLKKVIVPSSIKRIYGLAFENCKNLKTIVLEGKKAPKLTVGGFELLNKKCKIYVKNKKVKKSILKQLKHYDFEDRVIVKK